MTLVNSEALEYEMKRIPDSQRHGEMEAILKLTTERLEITDAAERLAKSLEHAGIRPMDAIHLALASTAKVDFFATCDDRFLRKAKAEAGLECKAVSVLALVSEALL